MIRVQPADALRKPPELRSRRGGQAGGLLYPGQRLQLPKEHAKMQAQRFFVAQLRHDDSRRAGQRRRGRNRRPCDNEQREAAGDSHANLDVDSRQTRLVSLMVIRDHCNSEVVLSQRRIRQCDARTDIAGRLNIDRMLSQDSIKDRKV